MGRKLDALLGRNFKTSKFKTMAKLAISRVSILKNQRQSRYSHARSDVLELLNLGHHERALLRVEYVIKEQNMLDALTMIESYCHLLIERAMLIQNNKDHQCPEELKEEISSLMFASSRCGEFPELQKVREMLTLWFGKEFTARAVELRNNCGVNPKIVQKFSSRQPSLESRLKVLKEIASENGITLHLEELTPSVIKISKDVNHKQQDNSSTDGDSKNRDETHGLNLEEELSESVKTRRKYRDAAAAARDAFQSAAYAAVAARAAVELSNSGSHDNNGSDDDDNNGYDQRQRRVLNLDESSTANSLQEEKDTVTEEEHSPYNNTEHTKLEDNEIESVSALSSDLNSDVLMKEDGLEDVDIEIENNTSLEKYNDPDSKRKPASPVTENQHDAINYEDDYIIQGSTEVDTLKSQDDTTIKSTGSETRSAVAESLDYVEKIHLKNSDLDWKPISMRTRPVQRV